MKIIAKFVLAAAVVSLSAHAANGQVRDDQTVRIAAVVNKDVISVNDLNARLRFVMATSRIQDNQENRRRLAPEVLNGLIDEKLQLQEAARLRIDVSTDEVREAVEALEQQNRIPRGQLVSQLRRAGISPQTLLDRIQANIAWGKVVGRAIRAEIQVSEEEIDDVLRRLSENRDRVQYQVSEIFLPVDAADQERRVQTTAQRLMNDIRMGASFDALARQFSQSSTASIGGDLGTVYEGQLDPELEAALKRVKTGQVIGPVRTVAGYYILFLRDRRTLAGGNPDVTTVSFAQVVMPIEGARNNESIAAARKKAEEAARDADSCAAFVDAASKGGATVARENPSVPVSDLPQSIRQIVTRLKPGERSAPVTGQNGVAIFMTCARSADGLPSREEVRNILGQQKMGNRAQQYMRELRRQAFVDIRV